MRELLGVNESQLKQWRFDSLPDEVKEKEIAEFKARIEELQKKEKQKEMLEDMHSDELERLENFRELLIFSEIPTDDYLRADYPDNIKQKTTLITYHPLGSEEYE